MSYNLLEMKFALTKETKEALEAFGQSWLDRHMNLLEPALTKRERDNLTTLEPFDMAIRRRDAQRAAERVTGTKQRNLLAVAFFGALATCDSNDSAKNILEKIAALDAFQRDALQMASHRGAFDTNTPIWGDGALAPYIASPGRITQEGVLMGVLMRKAWTT